MKKTVGKRKVSTRKLGASVMALAVAVIMVFTMIPAEAFAKTVDLDTTTRYTESLGDDASTEYAGRVWTDKTVYEGDAAFDLYGGGKATVENDSDFLVAYSALATAQSIEGYSTVPLDVVFVIDMSGSMSKNTMDNRKTRMQNAAEALNDSMEELLELNEHVRVGVVGFNLDSTILLPLDHYEKISGQDFITAVDGDTIRIRAKGSSDTYNFEESTESGTNMQRGFWEGMNMLATVDSTIAVINGKNVERTPSIILLSDGEPSKASRNTTTTWWDLKGDNNRDGQTNPKSIYGMKALMTATYMKKAIDRKYGTPEVTVYSVGVGIADLDDNNRELAYATINPAAYLATDSTSMVRDLRNTWNNYANNRTATLDGYTFQHPSSYDIVETGAYSDLYYVDSYFDISNKEMMDTVFKSIIEEIIYEKAQAPTEIKTNDPLTDGYITYIDPVGEYMEVKELKSILYAGQEFELPSGYTPTTESDGSLVYKFTGEVHSAVYGDQNLANIIIKVSPDRDQITIQIPAALIPIRVNSVVLDANGHVLTHTNNGAYPIRVLYTVGVKDGVLSADGSVTSAVAQTYIDQNSNDDGTVNFYSNKYSGKTYTLPNGETVTIGDATVEFSPSKENQFYYAQEDMAIYTDEECTTPAKGSLDDNKTYYYKEEFYHENHEDHTAVARTGKQLKAQTLNTNAAGELFIKAGSPLINRMMEFEGKKKNNATETASEFYVPTFNEEHNDIIVYLGNNGVLTAKASGTLEFSKEVNAAAGLTAPDKEFTFTVDFAGADGEYQYIITDALGNIIGDDDSDGYTGKIKDNGTIKLKDGQNAKIINLPAGAKYTVTETEVSEFTTTVNGVEQSNATGTVVAGEGSVFEFVNTYSAQPVSVNVNTTFDGAKVLTGRDWTDEDSFTFKLESRRADTPMPEGSTLVAGSHMVKEVTVTAPAGTAAGTAVDYVFGADGETIQYTKPGVYEYVISEKMPDVDLPGVSYSGAMYVVTVTVTDNGDGTLAALAVMSKVLDDSGKDFAAIDNEVEKATFTNAFDTEHVTWVPVGSKYYVDNSGSRPIETGMFEFEMKGLDGAPMPERAGGRDTFVVTNVDTEVAYDAVEFTKEHAGASEALAKEYTYEFREVIPSTPLNGMTYEKATYTVNVKVYLKDGSIVVDPEYPSGTRLEFANVYTPEKTTAEINGTKVIDGRDWLSSDAFTFELEAVTDGAPMPAVSTVTVDNSVDADTHGVKAFAFEDIEYTKTGVYEYKVYETGTDKNGIALDKHVCSVKVTVTDENGKLAAKVVYDGGAGHDTAEFVNKYTPVFDDSTAVNVTGSKELSGKAILAGEFYFRVEPQEGAPMGSSYGTNMVRADGTFDILKDVKYDKAGTYYYKVTESIPDDAVGGVHQGITYDDNEFVIKVVVTDDNAGKLKASWSIMDGGETVGAVVFKNEYNTKDAYLKLPAVAKTVTGRDFDPAAEKYSFTLSAVSASPADGIKLPAAATVQNDDEGRIAFDEITFTKPGTYVVEISEVIPADPANGMSYDDHKITITVDVVDTGTGELKVTYKNVSGKAGFENVYKAAPVDVTLQGSKTLEGRALTADDKFNFAITATTADAPMPAVTNVTNSGEKVSFGPVTYDKTGVYEYEIRETGTGADGITFDNGTVKAVVTVTDAGSDGQLDAKVDYVKSGEGAGFQFINKYDAKSTSVEFKGTKTLDGVKLLEGKFSFVLRPAGSNPAADPLKGESVVTNSADGAFNFGSLTFTEPGIYVYGIGEEAGSYHGMSYDATLYTVTVTVTDNGKGQLTAKTDVLKTNSDESHADVTINDIKFHNVYDADTAEVVIHGHKYLEGAELTDGQFHFEIKAKTAGAPMPAVTNVASTAAGQFHFPNIVFNAKDFGTEAKVFEYEITEVKGSAAGYTYDSHVETVKVTVQKDDKGVMYADVEYANDHAVEFYNKYEAAPVTAAVKAIKTLSGRDLKAGEFEFELKGEAGAPMPANATAANDELGNIAFGEITFSRVGAYKYTVVEKDNAIGGITYDSSVYGVIIDVTDVGHDGQLDAKVTYVYNGKEVKEIEFSNEYKTAEGSYDLPIYKKVVTGRDFDPAAEKYSFELSVISADPADGIKLPETSVVQNDNAGMIDFGSIKFTKAGTYIVGIKEVVPSVAASGMIYDTDQIVVTITVRDNGAGQLVAEASPLTSKEEFNNSYEAKGVNVTLEGEKSINGRDLTADDEFTFAIRAKTEGAPVPAVTTVTNNGSDISFGPIEYNTTGVYEYEIVETGVGVNGITYDNGTVKAIVTVTDKGYDGQLDATVEYVKSGSGSGFQFINEYKSASVDVSFNGTKKLTGVVLKEGKFNFILKPAESNPAADPLHGESVVTNAADGTFDFGKLTYTEQGVYVYGIAEKAGDYHGMHYDATLYTVTVTVTDNGKGQMVAETAVLKTNPDESHESVTMDDVLFHNVYDADTAEAVIHGHKHLDGAAMTDGQFHFEIKAKTAGAPMPAVTNVANTAAGVFQFPAITFDAKDFGTEAKVFEYVITEVQGRAEGYTYDASEQIVKVTVQKDSKGVINADIKYQSEHAAEFYNKYEANPVSAALKSEKILNGRDLKAGEFTFVLTGESGAPMPGDTTAVNDEAGVVEFDDIQFTETGTYKYTVTEKNTGESGITYDAGKLHVTVKVTDEGYDGQLDAEVIYEDTAKFINEYTPKAANVHLTGSKELAGRDLRDGEFAFVIEAVTADAPMPAEKEVVNAADGTISFGTIHYEKAGSYEYLIREKAGSVGGITYDATPVKVIVTVDYDSAKGVFTTDVAYDKAGENAFVFENEYEATPVEADFEITKNLTGRAWNENDEFEFKLAAEGDTVQAVKDGKVVMTETSATAVEADKTVEFSGIKFKEVGTYNFVITETAGSEAGMVYDAHEVHAIVTVTDDSKGVLSAAVTYSGSKVFENKYTPDPVTVTLTGEKNLEGRALTDKDAFTFELEAVTDKAPMPAVTEVTNAADGTISFGEIIYASAGTYEYLIKEKSGSVAGVTYDTVPVKAIVKVEYNEAKGAFETAVSYDKAGKNEFVFNNKYKASPVSVGFEGTKVLKGAELYADAFTFVLRPAESNPAADPVKEEKTTTNAANGAFSFGEYEFTEPGVYVYGIGESEGDYHGMAYDATLYTVVVRVTDDGNGQLTAKERVIRINPDDTRNEVTLDDIVFNNEYDPHTASVVIHGHKHLEGAHLEDGQFSFTIEAKTDGAPMPAVTTVANTEAGMFHFPEIVFSADDYGKDTTAVYEYVVKEVDGNKTGYTYDNEAEVVKVTVQKDEKGVLYVTAEYEQGHALEFRNSYKPEPVDFTVEGTKELTGRELKAGEFTFELKDAEGKVAAEAVNTANGTFAFDAVEFEKAGTYTYTVSEKDTNAAGITYDTATYAVVIKVVDEDGVLKIQSAEYMQNNKAVDSITFSNTYKPASTGIQLSATKTLEGRDWFDTDKFTFTMTPDADTEQAVADGIVKMDKETVTITKATADKTASFGYIEFEKAGTYNFVIEETAGNIEGVTYDTHKATVSVTVTDNLDGTMSAVATPTVAGSLTFVNTYVPKAVTAFIEGTKVLTGRTLAADEFAFEIKAVTTDAPMPGVTTVKNAADGTVSFGAITYNKAGTYEYEITETKGDLAGITYDGSVIKATVEVSYDKSTGLLSAEVSYEGTSDENGFVFNNEYNAKPVSIKLDAGKKVVASEGNAYELKAGDFKFELTPADSNPDSDPIDKAVVVENDAAGNVDLGTLEFTEEGDYTYTVKEISGNIAGMNYDDTVYTITVKVTDNEAKAQLEAVTAITAADKSVDAMAFENKYDPAETSVHFDGKKVLESEHKALEADEFTFQLKGADGKVIDTVTNSAAGTFQFDSITYDREGTYEYTVSEVNDGKAGYTYDDAVYNITVVVTDENGALKADVTGGTATDIVFTNGYEPAPTDLVIKGHKALTGRDLNEGEFEFAVLDGEKEVATASNRADGSFAFGALEFTKAGTYNYTIVEKNTNIAGVVYDQLVYGVTVKVVDKDGVLKVESADYLNEGKSVETITFNNTYKPAPTSIQLGAVKVLEGRDLTAGEFKFVLEDKDGNKMYAENAADGKIIFDEINYDAAGTYTYKLYEESGDAKHMIYDETVYDITVTVKDDLEGSLKATIEGMDNGAVFKNVYTPKEPTDPEKPTKPEEPTKPMDETSDGGTQTGDDFNTGLYGFLALAALAVAGAALRRRKVE